MDHADADSELVPGLCRMSWVGVVLVCAAYASPRFPQDRVRLRTVAQLPRPVIGRLALCVQDGEPQWSLVILAAVQAHPTARPRFGPDEHSGTVDLHVVDLSAEALADRVRLSPEHLCHHRRVQGHPSFCGSPTIRSSSSPLSILYSDTFCDPTSWVVVPSGCTSTRL